MKVTRPEDILPDDINQATINGVSIRKGSVAAVLANAEVLADDCAEEQDKQAAMVIIEELAPSLAAIGMYKHVI